MKLLGYATFFLLMMGLGGDTRVWAKEGKPKAAKIRLTPKRGYFDKPVTLTISSEASGAKIYYTTDGTAPTPATGRLYSEPIVLKTTTTVRAAGFADGNAVTELDCHTYLFLADVLKQNGAGAPATWGTTNGQPVRADYEMDPEIVEQAAYRDSLPGAFRAIPTLSVVMDTKELFGADHGIYAHPMESGDDWERLCSIELMGTDDPKGFQVDCGIRIQGGWNRRPEESPKHAFRLVFKKKYGPGKLKHQVFDRDGPEEFDQLILRAGCNNSWLHWSGVERVRGDYIRDQWMRDTYAAMGQPSARGRYVHLFLNGLYWGIYNLTERPDEHFASGYFGGKEADYDARNGEHILSGDDVAWKRLFTMANAGPRSETAYAAIQELLDVPSFCDFMILNLYGGNADWDRASNWYAARRRSPPGRFHFFVWDAERTLEGVTTNTVALDDDFSPLRLFQKLRENAEFRLQFADRVQRHLFGNGGALMAKPAGDRFRAWVDLLDKPIVAESARWGDYRRDAHPYKEGPYALYTRNDHWRPEVDRLLKEFFPQRPAALVKILREADLFPRLDAPVARKIDRATELSLGSGSIVFTEDGTDPRLPGGRLSASARRYDRPVAAEPGRKFKARATAGPESSPQWSALIEF